MLDTYYQRTKFEELAMYHRNLLKLSAVVTYIPIERAGDRIKIHLDWPRSSQAPADSVPKK